MSSSLPLSETPAAAPPPGVTPNLVDPLCLDWVSITVCSIMMGLCTIFVAGRLCSNIFVTRTVGLDDYLIVVAWALSSLFASLTIQQSYAFRHQWDVPAIWFTATKSKITFTQGIVLGPATFFAKASLLLLYLRIFGATKKSFKMVIYCTLGFCTALYWVNVPLEIAFCAPLHGQAWNDAQLEQQCAKTIVFGIVQGVLNIIVDFWILLLPLPIIWNLNMTRNKKLWISGIFMTGILGCAASILGLVYRVKVNYSADGTWNANILYLAVLSEIDAAIICSAMPSFASLVKRGAKKGTQTFRTSRSRSRTEGLTAGTANHGGGNSNTKRAYYFSSSSKSASNNHMNKSRSMTGSHSNMMHADRSYIELVEKKGGLTHIDQAQVSASSTTASDKASRNSDGTLVEQQQQQQMQQTQHDNAGAGAQAARPGMAPVLSSSGIVRSMEVEVSFEDKDETQARHQQLHHHHHHHHHASGGGRGFRNDYGGIYQGDHAV